MSKTKKYTKIMPRGSTHMGYCSCCENNKNGICCFCAAHEDCGFYDEKGKLIKQKDMKICECGCNTGKVAKVLKKKVKGKK